MAELDLNNPTILTTAQLPTYTYQVNWEEGTVSGFTDKQEAMEQAIYKILLTERFDFLIYSWNYGFESRLIIGRGTSIVNSLIGRLITEALLADSRITSITDFASEVLDKRTLFVSFTARTVFGLVDFERKIDYGGQL